MPAISSRHHAVVRACRAAARGEGPHALIDGWHLLREAVDAALDIELVATSGEPAAADAAVLAQAAERAPRVSVTRSVMGAMSPVRSPSGVVALVAPRRHGMPVLLQAPTPLVVVAVDMQDPGNVGALIRSAEAGGATGVVVAGASAHPWGWKALRAAMGSTFRLPVVVATGAAATCEALQLGGLRLLATRARDGTSLDDVDLRRPAALLIGGEGGGLPPALVAMADERLFIPMHPRVESLNAAVAAGILVYEARRQRTCQT